MKQTLTKLKGKIDSSYDNRLLHKTFNNEQNIQTDDQQGNSGFKEHCKPIRSNKTYKDTLTKRAAVAVINTSVVSDSV